MARTTILRSVEGALTDLYTRLRALERRISKVGNWTLVEDQSGNLTAVRDNGDGTKTVQVVASTEEP